MKKIERNFEVKFNFDWTYGVEISRLKEDIDKLEKLGATHVDIETEDSYGSCSVNITAYCRRLETDAEFQERVEFEQKQESRIKEMELAQLSKLKAKYGQ